DRPAPAPLPDLPQGRPVPLPGPARSRGRSPVRPGLAAFVVVLVVALSLSTWAWQHHRQAGIMSWATTVLWTLPITTSLIGLAGAVRTRRALRPAAVPTGPPAVVHDQFLIVVVPTIGRHDTYPALERVVRSYVEHLPAFFARVRVDVVIEEGCAAASAIIGLAVELPSVRVLTVPAHYRTPAGTRFKARANHYANVRRVAEGQAAGDVWVLHMDDDTGVDRDTAEQLARFVHAQRGPHGLHLGQGVLTYPREHGAHRLLWLADAVRPSSDVSVFAISTGRGTPRAGLHGELLLVRASVEAVIGWDFGPRAMVEDAQFALNFGYIFPGRSGWFPGRSLGATPVTVRDFVTQRERWAWGLMELAANRAIPLRHRLLLIHNMVIWASGPLQHVAVILTVGALLGDLETLPVVAALLPLWAINIAYQVWTYWEGLKINCRASADDRRRWWERVAVVLLMPLFSLWEAAGVLRGAVLFVRGGETSFAVIAKPR
ncbi:MAG TPA: glycosyltransferase family 2 protein, partial [Pseudonocardia sp.]|nr:glycosyltransferase family 2 protein [Pseudonocardia sp.]